MNQDEIIFAVGALTGAIGSLWFIVRNVPADDTLNGRGKKRLAVLTVLAVYVVMAFVATAIGIALQATGVAAIGGLFWLCAIASFVFVWQSDAVNRIGKNRWR
jgi:uncharacterized Tic20 family protein